MENIKVINKFLEATYGRAQDNKPKFRVAWSEDLYEVRKGLFGELAVFEEIKKAKKYTYIQDRWILDIYTLAYPKIFGRAISQKNEIVMSGDGYESLRVFQTRKGEDLKPDMEVCKIICDGFVELVNRPEGRRLTAKQADYDDKKKMDHDVERRQPVRRDQKKLVAANGVAVTYLAAVHQRQRADIGIQQPGFH